MQNDNKNIYTGGRVRSRAGFLAAGLIGAGLAALAVPANAADAIDLPPEAPVADTVMAPVANWSGFYAGSYLGYNFGKFDTSAGDVDANGFGGGLFIGGNSQIGSIVYGAEIDGGYSGANGSLGGVEAEQNFNGSVRARLGYDFSPVLIYGTAGVAITGVEVDDGVNSDRNAHIGWTVGAGADAMITQRIFGRLEYRYTDFESKDYDLGGTTISSGFNEQSVKAGIGIKF